MADLPERIIDIEVDAFNSYSGSLTQPAQYSFQYKGEQSVSLTMNKKEEAYNSGVLHPVFAQNLPEGYVRRYIFEKLERHARVNDLYLLALQKDKGIGHLSFRSKMQAQNIEQLSLSDILSWKGDVSIFPELLNKFYLGGFASGVQPKVLLNNVKAVANQKDLIVKTFDDEYPLLTVNEFVCMSAAKAAGLNPPEFWLSDDLRTFVIQRFDKTENEKLAIEDFSVLTGKEKYSGSYEVLLKAVSVYTKNPEEVKRAYRYIVFNCLIGNGDAHLKNFSVQYSQNRSDIKLTPPYDITHTLVYPTIDNKMALKIGGAKSFPNKKELIKLAEKEKIKGANDIIDEMAESIQAYLNQSEEVELVAGLKQSIERSLSHACATSILKHRPHFSNA
tara:strand:- start:3082 stop:4248 length:1167 start_codon:yes stop_codon:yes gene_type:complete